METEFIKVCNAYGICTITSNEYETLKREKANFKEQYLNCHAPLSSNHYDFLVYKDEYFMYCKQDFAALLALMPIASRSLYRPRRTPIQPPSNITLAYIFNAYAALLAYDPPTYNQGYRNETKYIMKNIIAPKYYDELCFAKAHMIVRK